MEKNSKSEYVGRQKLSNGVYVSVFKKNDKYHFGMQRSKKNDDGSYENIMDFTFFESELNGWIGGLQSLKNALNIDGFEGSGFQRAGKD